MKRHIGWLAVLVPLVALLECAAQDYVSRRAPELDAWRQLREPVRRLLRPGDAVVVAPRWAEPLARATLDSPTLSSARGVGADLSSAERALEISMLSTSTSETSDWPVEHRENLGPFTLQIRKNPRPVPVLFDFVKALARGGATAHLERGGRHEECRWSSDARTHTGGLHGPMAVPRARFDCRAGSFAGVSIIDDQRYEPRRCMLVSVPSAGELVLAFDAPLEGSKVRGHLGSSFFLTRGDRVHTSSLAVWVNERRLGTIAHQGPQGWVPFEFDVQRSPRARVEFRVSQRSEDGTAAVSGVCFQAEVQ